MAGILNIQIKPTIGDKEINLKKVEHFMKKHSDKKLDLVVFPEFFSTGVNGKAFDEVPEDENGGETIARVKELAKKFNTNIVAGSVIERVGDKSYNTCFVIDRKGEVVGKYRKIHLYNYMGGTEGEHV
jgi:predicted amidohydrolase